MLSSSLAPYLPDEIKPNEWDEILKLSAGLGGSFGETHMIRQGDRLVLLTRPSSYGTLQAVDLDPDILPQIQKQKWKTILGLTTADSGRHEFSLSHDERVRAADALEQHFVTRKAWQELADLLRVRVDAATGSDRLTALHRLGRVLLDRLEQPEAAYTCFNDILAQRPDHEGGLEGLEGLFFRGFLEAKIGPVLETRFRRHHEHEKLALLLTQVAPLRKTAAERAAAWLEAAELRESRMRDPAGALLVVGKALAEAPLDKKTNQLFDDLAARTKQWSEARELIGAALGREQGAAEARHLLWKRARISEEHLGDLDDVGESMRAVVELDDKDFEAWRVLDRTYLAQEKWLDLAAVLERMVAVLPPTTERTDLTYRLGVLAADKLDDLEYARKCFDRVLDRLTYHLGSFQQLEKVHRARGEWDELLALLERWQALESDEKILNRLLLSLGTVHEQLGREERAIEFLRRLLELEPNDTGALEALVRLHGKLEDWSAAVDALERLAACQARPADAMGRYRDAAVIAEEALGDRDRALELLLKADRASTGDVDVLHAIRRLSRDLGRDDSLALALEGLLGRDRLSGDEKGPLRIELADTLTRLKRLDDALAVWRRVLAEEPEDMHAVDRVIEIYSTTERWSEAAETLERAVEVAGAPAARVPLLMQLAGIYDERLHDLDRAAKTYQRVLDLDEDHDEALERIEEIYQAREDWAGLVELHELRARLADDGDRRVGHLVAAAVITATELGRPERALGSLLSLVPEHWSSEELATALGRIAAATELWPDTLRAMENRHDKLLSADDKVTFGRCIDAMLAALQAHRKPGTLDGDLHLEVANHYLNRRAEPEVAATYFRKAARDPDTRRSAREGLRVSLRRSEQWKELAALLEEMAVTADLGDFERGRLYDALAHIYIEELGEPEKGREAQAKSTGGSSRVLWWLCAAILVAAAILYYLRFLQ